MLEWVLIIASKLSIIAWTFIWWALLLFYFYSIFQLIQSRFTNWAVKQEKFFCHICQFSIQNRQELFISCAEVYSYICTVDCNCHKHLKVFRKQGNHQGLFFLPASKNPQNKTVLTWQTESLPQNFSSFLEIYINICMVITDLILLLVVNYFCPRQSNISLK